MSNGVPKHWEILASMANFGHTLDCDTEFCEDEAAILFAAVESLGDEIAHSDSPCGMQNGRVLLHLHDGGRIVLRAERIDGPADDWRDEDDEEDWHWRLSATWAEPSAHERLDLLAAAASG